ncbi:MAG: hypothetical protein U9Q35_03045 [Pseudomonadota bacterium]|nr:hypothetical protein [Pseudomonadota bacterium]
MPTAPIFLSQPKQDASLKHRLAGSLYFDLHALGIQQIDGAPVQQFVSLPPRTEPGAIYRVVTLNGWAMLEEDEGGNLPLIPVPLVMVCDSAGDQGELGLIALV